MRMICAAAVLAALVIPASAKSAKDDPRGPQWHFMDRTANMQLAMRPWCVPNTPQWAQCPHKGSNWKGTWTIK